MIDCYQDGVISLAEWNAGMAVQTITSASQSVTMGQAWELFQPQW